MMTLRHHNFFYLLAGLLFVLLAIPVFRDLTGTVNHYVSELAFSVFLLIGIWSLYGTRRVFLLGIALVTLGVGGNILALAGMGIFFVYLSLCSYTFFLLLSIDFAVRQVVRSGTVDANRIIGAICIYLLLGVIWAFFYLFANILIPGSFNVQISGSAYGQLQDFLHYSFVTLTTLGYGDITPVRATARALSTIEAIIGQFYIAILVAGLMAAFIAQNKSPSRGS